MKRLLIQTQLSNYTKEGKFVLECDSGWQMVIGRIRELLKLNPELHITVTGPYRWMLKTDPEEITPEFSLNNLIYYPHYIPTNALLSRHHFNVAEMEELREYDYDAIYINDPMQFRNYKACFKSKLFIVHNHFIDNPSCPKFPRETSLWLGQCEAVQRADVNFWQCQSALDVFETDFGAKAPNSYIWDDGYSDTEINTPVNMNNVRFDPNILHKKPIVFVPNRVGKEGISSDYTNCGKFLFEILPELGEDFNVVAGNPSQKISNKQLPCLQLVEGTLTRDEYKLIASKSTIVIALYDKDTYGGTAVRECIALGCLPLWLDCNEYRILSKKAWYPYLCKTDFSNIGNTFETILKLPSQEKLYHKLSLQNTIYYRCSHEVTTLEAAKRMNLL